ncbi:nucleotidyltransferase domain-containing protein [Halolamina salina]|uniref:Nucleotidyltransferase domain-containing protein n=1 Tax=Halolamina salina TaxID=1220023 RepID=A0ABD6B6B2_9EURY
MPTLDGQYRNAIETLAPAVDDVPWALTGSASFALQGVPVEPDDIDVQTTAAGAYAIESAFEDRVVDPVSLSTGERIKSHFGVLELHGLRVEIMGAVQKRRPDGTWESPVDVEAHRTFVELDGRSVPVLSLAYEADAYERLGRHERAELLPAHADDP